MLSLALFLIVANILFSVCFFVFMKKRFSRERVIGDIEKELESLYKDLQREIDNSVSIIEDRTAALRAIISAADKRILLAASEIEKREKSKALISKYAETQAEDKNKAEMVAAKPEIYTRRQIIERAAGADTNFPKFSKSETSPREQVVLLARQDISPEEIATILSLPRSEVDLILALDL